MKRAFDLIISASAIIAVGWLIGLLVIAVRLTSYGPGIFAQARVGRNMKVFTCYKLRTMAVGTPSKGTHETAASAMTCIGGTLRRFKLDEIPQLWNVLKGDMSLVGPRPCLPVQEELIRQRRARGVFEARPGITGKAQILGIDMSDPEKLACVDAEYVAEQNFFGDLVLLLKTVTGSGQGDRIRV
jgi:O-antigen biosynthesis protein WbqP